MDWDCELGILFNYYLYVFLNEMKLCDLVYDLFCLIFLFLWLNFVFKLDFEESNEEVNNLGGEYKSFKF